MNTKPISCYKCGEIIPLENADDCWSTAFHVPFDTLQKIKQIVKHNCLCTKCITNLEQTIAKQI